MNEPTNDRFFAGTGVASVVPTLTGALVAMIGGKTHELTVGTSAATYLVSVG
jgi:hypothetical protein